MGFTFTHFDIGNFLGYIFVCQSRGQNREVLTIMKSTRSVTKSLSIVLLFVFLSSCTITDFSFDSSNVSFRWSISY